MPRTRFTLALTLALAATLANHTFAQSTTSDSLTQVQIDILEYSNHVTNLAGTVLHDGRVTDASLKTARALQGQYIPLLNRLEPILEHVGRDADSANSAGRDPEPYLELGRYVDSLWNHARGAHFLATLIAERRVFDSTGTLTDAYELADLLEGQIKLDTAALAVQPGVRQLESLY